MARKSQILAALRDLSPLVDSSVVPVNSLEILIDMLYRLIIRLEELDRDWEHLPERLQYGFEAFQIFFDRCIASYHHMSLLSLEEMEEGFPIFAQGDMTGDPLSTKVPQWEKWIENPERYGRIVTANQPRSDSPEVFLSVTEELPERTLTGLRSLSTKSQMNGRR